MEITFQMLKAQLIGSKRVRTLQRVSYLLSKVTSNAQVQQQNVQMGSSNVQANDVSADNGKVTATSGAN